MRVVIVGLGVQGKKRLAVAGKDVVATVDPVVADAKFKSVEQVPLDSYDTALLCVPDRAKIEQLNYLLSRGKHALVEKPLLSAEPKQLAQLESTAQKNRAICYTAYNHRFEPHIVGLKELLDKKTLGEIYLVKAFYGNGTAIDVKRSPWRDQGIGVFSDLGSHLLDMTAFLFGKTDRVFKLWNLNRFENRAPDHVLFGAEGKPVLEYEGTMVSWRNTFTLEVFGELGSAHINGLCKWGPSTLTTRKRVYPSGRPLEEVKTIEAADPTWALEYEHFKKLCAAGNCDLQNDIWINSILNDLARAAGEELL